MKAVQLLIKQSTCILNKLTLKPTYKDQKKGLEIRDIITNNFKDGEEVYLIDRESYNEYMRFLQP